MYISVLREEKQGKQEEIDVDITVSKISQLKRGKKIKIKIILLSLILHEIFSQVFLEN